MMYDKYLDEQELIEYRKHTQASINDMEVENVIRKDMGTINDEVGGQQGMYNNFPISRVYRDIDSIRVYCLTSEGGIAIIEKDEYFKIVTLGEDDGYHFLNSSELYCSFYGTKTSFVWALSEALSLFNNIKL